MLLQEDYFQSHHIPILQLDFEGKSLKYIASENPSINYNTIAGIIFAHRTRFFLFHSGPQVFGEIRSKYNHAFRKLNIATSYTIIPTLAKEYKTRSTVIRDIVHDSGDGPAAKMVNILKKDLGAHVKSI